MQKRTLFISRLAIILSLTIVIQIAGLPQPVTGPLINSMLFLTAMLFGNPAGILLGCLTPTIAVIRGQLPAMLAPMVPFIAVANSILVIVFTLFVKQIRKKNALHKSFQTYLGIFAASLAKFSVLFVSVKIILPFVFSIKLPDKVLVLMSFPQFITAIIGGILALILYRLFKKAGLNNETD